MYGLSDDIGDLAREKRELLRALRALLKAAKDMGHRPTVPFALAVERAEEAIKKFGKD
jgi:hypothetical protein